MLRVTLDIYSGRPNPTYRLSQAEKDILLVMLVYLAQSYPPASLPTGLGYRGFRVDGVGEGDDNIRVYREHILIHEESRSRTMYLQDPDRTVERWLAERFLPLISSGALQRILED